MKYCLMCFGLCAVLSLSAFAFESATASRVQQTVSHSGGTDAYGCHCDRRNGGCVYHCH